MFDLQAYLLGLAAIAILALAAWLVGSLRRDVTVVDSFWSLFFLVATVTYASQVAAPGRRAALVLGMVALWALRLAGHLTWRNRGKPEDHRYQAIRRNHEPHFAWKSLYLVFGLQGILAWVISLPLLAAVGGQRPLGVCHDGREGIGRCGHRSGSDDGSRGQRQRRGGTIQPVL